MTRLRTRIRTATTLIRHRGVIEGGRIALALDRGDAHVSFADRGRRYRIATDQSTTYNLMHNLEPLRRLAAYVRPSDTAVVDVGAHSGLFSAFALDRAPGASLIVIEPDPSLEDAIRWNLKRSANWNLIQKAVGASIGRATFFRNPASTQTSSLLLEAVQPFGREVDSFEVDITTLDDVLKDTSRIDVLKVDVQGAESMVIRGAESTLGRVRTLLVEVSLLGPDACDLLGLLEADFGPPARVNLVAGGADLAFERKVEAGMPTSGGSMSDSP